MLGTGVTVPISLTLHFTENLHYKFITTLLEGVLRNRNKFGTSIYNCYSLKIIIKLFITIFICQALKLVYGYFVYINLD